MALVEEADTTGDLVNGHAVCQQVFGPFNTELNLVGMGRQANGLPKHAVQMKGAQMGDLDEIVQGDVVGIVVHKIATHSLDGPVFVTQARRWGYSIGIATHEVCEQGMEQNRAF